MNKKLFICVTMKSRQHNFFVRSQKYETDERNYAITTGIFFNDDEGNNFFFPPQKRNSDCSPLESQAEMTTG
jgi:hypothetical protein